MNLKDAFISPFSVKLALVGLGALAVLKLGSEFYRLVFDGGTSGAVDLMMRFNEIHRWFDGLPVYGVMQNATYPPASYLLLWPFTGWESFQTVRWLWAALCVACLAWLVLLLIRECKPRSVAERWFIALIPLSMNATGIAIGNGQLSVLIMSLLIGILALSRKARTDWKTGTIITVFFLLALVKPSFTAPFFLVLLLVFPGYRVAGACILAYLLLTFLASIPQHQDMFILTTDWLDYTIDTNTLAAVSLDYGSVHSWLSTLGLSQWNAPSSFLLLFVLGAWIYRVRRVDLWLIFGVTALVARIWTYHGLYDDMLIIIPIIAVYRHMRQSSENASPGTYSLLLVSGSVFVMLLPARLYLVWEAPWPYLYAFSHVFSWFLLALYLVVAANRAVTLVAD